jgi:glutathione peroxidase
MPTFTDFDLVSLDGAPMPLSQYADHVVLMVNVASMCGMTPQYAGLEDLWRRYRDRGLVVMGCPCDQFGHQEPGTATEIATFCSSRYDVTFPMSSKLDVNGDHAHPLWQWMRQSEPGVFGTTAVKWNFTKFLVGRDGQVIARFAPTTTPEAITSDIEKALG